MDIDRGKTSPVAVFVYNRPEHTKKMLAKLNECFDAEKYCIHIFADGAKKDNDEKVLTVREIITEFKQHNSFESVVLYLKEKNQGLANSVITGVSSLINQYGSVIVLEDDLLVSRDFLRYMQGALEFYRNDDRVWSIAGYSPRLKSTKNYSHDVYLCERAGSWGWGTWKDRWDKVDWNVSGYPSFQKNIWKRIQFERRGPGMTKMLDMQMRGELDSWAIRFCYQQFLDKSYTINPSQSRVNNIGYDGSGTHCGNDDNGKWHNELDDARRDTKFERVKLNQKIKREFDGYFRRTIKQRIKNKIKKLKGLLSGV